MDHERNDDNPLGLTDGTLRLMRYRPEWPALFRQEAKRIRARLPPSLEVDIHHIGSTAVEGLAAKPILDIGLVGQPQDEQRIAELLVSLGYIDRGQRSGRLFIRRDGSNVRTHNLHLYGPDDPQLRRQIAFRDVLRRSSSARAEYVRLKTALLVGARKDYAAGKTEFVMAHSGN